MPIPSEVPTSFVPRAPVPSIQHNVQLDFLKMLLFSSLGVFAVSLLVSGGILLYQRSLEGQVSQKQTQLKSIEKTLNKSNVLSFVYLRDQLSSAQTILNKHLTFSRVFDFLETHTVNGLSFVDLKIDESNGKPATLEVDGVAENFNTLAAQAAVLKKNALLHNVTFSGFLLRKNGTVGFTLNAVLSNTLVQNFAAVVGIASSTQATLATTTQGLLHVSTTTNALQNSTTAASIKQNTP